MCQDNKKIQVPRQLNATLYIWIKSASYANKKAEC